MKFGTKTNTNMPNSMVMSTLSSFSLEVSFFGNFLEKLKLFVEAEI